jgi:hypothetical protein
MTTAKLFVPSGASFHETGRVALAPSQVNSVGSAPPSVTSELVSVKDPFEDVTACSDVAALEADGVGGGVPGATEQPVSNKTARRSDSLIFIFILLLWR